MKHSLTSIALGALLLSQSVLAGLYSSKDNVIDVTPKNFQAEVMDSNVKSRPPFSFAPAPLSSRYRSRPRNLPTPFSSLSVLSP